MKESASLVFAACPKHPGPQLTARPVFWALLLASMFVRPALADELKTVAGERLVGKAVSVNENAIVFSSVTLGKVSLARSNVLGLTLSSAIADKPAARTNLQTRSTSTRTNSEIAALLKSLPAQPELANNVSADLLAQAGPEATARFNQMLRGLLTGSISVSDLRAQAKSVRDQAQAMRDDLGEDAGAILDGYLAILDKFLAQSPPAQNAVTNSAR